MAPFDVQIQYWYILYTYLFTHRLMKARVTETYITNRTNNADQWTDALYVS
jgi:hypothetical protein